MSMNPALAALLGLTKTASDDDAEEINLSEISGADLLAGLQDGTIVLDGGDDAAEPEKTAGDDEDIDLSQVSARELLEAYAELEEAQAEKTAAATLEKMAEDGSLDFFDTAGRLMARSMMDEFSKVASEESGDLPDEIEVDLDELTGEQLVQLQQAGYEFVGDEGPEKTATVVGKQLNPLVRGAKKGGMSKGKKALLAALGLGAAGGAGAAAHKAMKKGKKD